MQRGAAACPPGLAQPRFVGRERELAELRLALSRPSAVALVEGEAGIGKSRLLQELLAHLPGSDRSALVAVCPAFREPYTLAPIVDALRHRVDSVAELRLSALAGALRPLFPEWAAHLPSAPDLAEDASGARHRVFAALEELLATLGLAILVVEDAHWADTASLELLLFLACRRPQPISLVVTYRPGEVPADSLLRQLWAHTRPDMSPLRLSLPPLTREQTAHLLSSMLQDEPVSTEFGAFVHDRTDGVPLAIEESVRLMHDRADLTRRNGAWVRHRVEEIQVPATVRDAVLVRVSRATPPAREVLQAAAVLGRPATEQTLAAVADLPEERCVAGLVEAVGSGLLTEDPTGRVAFRHALACQAVHEAMAGPLRRRLHRRAGQTLQAMSPVPVARLAHHFREAGATTEWCQYAEQAADAALAAGDAATAAGLLQELVVRAELPIPTTLRLTDKIVLLSLTGNRPLQDMAATLRAALAGGDLTNREEAEVRFQLGRMLLVLEEHEAGRAELEQAISQLAPGSLHAARAMMMLGWPLGATCPGSEHLEWLRRAAPAIEAQDRHERLRLVVDRATALLMLGDETGWALAAQVPEDAQAPQDRLQVTRGNGNLGEAAMMWGRYREARRRLACALALADRYQYRRLQEGALIAVPLLDWYTGHWDGLAERIALLRGDDVAQPTTQLVAGFLTGLLHSAAGATTQAVAVLEGVLAELLRRGAVDYVTGPAAALARLRLAQGDGELAVTVTEEPLGIAVRKSWLWATDLAPARAKALVSVGRIDEAADLVEAFARGICGREAPGPHAGLITSRAILAEARGEPDRAAGLFARASSAWLALPRPYDALLTRERQARCLFAAGKHSAALAVLADTEQGLTALGATGDADRIAHNLREHAITVPRVWRGGKRGYGSDLSPREREVVRLAAAGHTNRHIAELLFRSPNTVASQLKAAMRKLGVTSRAALPVSLTDTDSAANG